jgi:hypothetical protein
VNVVTGKPPVADYTNALVIERVPKPEMILCAENCQQFVLLWPIHERQIVASRSPAQLGGKMTLD